MAIVTQTFERPWVVLIRRSGFGQAQIMQGEETITYDDSFYDVDEGETVAEALKKIITRAPEPQEGTDLEGLRADRMGQIELWWDRIAGVDVGDGIKLPVGDAQVALNGVQLTLWQQRGDFGAPLRILDRDGLTVEIAGADVGTKLSLFYSGYALLGQHYDAVKKAIIEATTIPELLQIQMYPEV